MKTFSVSQLLLGFTLMFIAGVIGGIGYQKSKNPCPEPEIIKLEEPSIPKPGLYSVSTLNGYVEPLNLKAYQVSFKEEIHNGHIFGVWVVIGGDGHVSISTQKFD